MTGLSVALICDAEALASLEAEWWTLWQRSPAATPFQTPAWLLPWWRHFAPGELRTVTVRDADRLVGLAPFYLEDGLLGRRLLPLGMSLSDHLDILVDPDCAGAVGAAIVDQMATSRDWDRWELEELAPDAAALLLPCPSRHKQVLDDQSACPVLVLSGLNDSLPERIPPERRQRLRRAWRLAEAAGGMEIERVETESAGFLDALFRLHGARWKRRGEDGVLSDDRVRGFQREALPLLLQAGLARAYVLRIGGVVAGVYYGLQDRGRAYAYLGGFDPDFSYESPGAILIGHAITQAARECAREFDFLRGRERYKYQWGAVDRWNRRRSFQKVVR